MKKSIVPLIGASVGMLALILDSKTALNAAQSAIDMCIKIVIPSLFPFFVLSDLLTSSAARESFPHFRPIGKLLDIPKGAESLLITGFLGGYPTGAKCVAQAYQDGQLSKGAAEHMLPLCSNAGPAFIFGIAGTLFPETWMIWAVWGIQILSTFTVGLLLPIVSTKNKSSAPTSWRNLSQSISSALHACAMVCGWIILFRIITLFAKRWFLFFLPEWSDILVTGVLELANGCLALGNIPSIELRFVLCSTFLSFGGVCVILQTVSVTKGLSIRWYLVGKLIQAGISLVMALTVILKNVLLLVVLFSTFLCLAMIRNRKKSVAFLPNMVYNADTSPSEG